MKYTYFLVDANNSNKASAQNFRYAKKEAKAYCCDLFRECNKTGERECVFANPDLVIE